MNSQRPLSVPSAGRSGREDAAAGCAETRAESTGGDRRWERLAEVLAPEGSRDRLCEDVCRVMVEEFGFSRALIATLDDDGRRLVTRASHDPAVSTHVMRALRRLFTIPLAPQADGRRRIAAWCVLAGEQVHVPDASAYAFRTEETVQTDSLVKVFAAEEYVLTPIPVSGGAVGLIAVDKKGRSEAIRPAELDSLRAVASLTGLGLDASRTPLSTVDRQSRSPVEAPQDRPDRQGQMQAVLDELRQGLLVLDQDRVVRYVNRAASSLIGRLPWDTVGEPWRDVLPLADPDAFGRYLAQPSRPSPYRSRNWRFESPETGPVVARVDVLPLPSVHGGEGIALVLDDVTDRAEEERVRDEFVSMLVHDLSAPVQGILGFAELLLMERAGPLDGTQRDFISRIIASSEMMTRLIRDILRLGDLEAGRALLETGLLDPRSLVEEVLDRLGGLAGTSRVELRNAVAPALPPIRGDRLRLGEALQNVVANAIEASAPGAEILVQAQVLSGETGDRLRLQVVDEGVGLAEDQVAYLFDKYRSVRRGTRRDARASGLGLAIARLVVEAHGGRIGASSVSGRGTTVTIDLPSEPPKDSSR